MKGIKGGIIGLLLILLVGFPVWGFEQGIKGKTETVINAQTVAVSGNYTSAPAYSVSGSRGFFSLQYTVTGSGTCKFEYLISNNNSDFIEPSTASDITSGITATSGPGSDGKDIVSFTPEPCQWIKIKVTETGGASTVTVTAVMLEQ